MNPAKLTAALLLSLYLGAGLSFASAERFADIGQTPLPKNLARWTSLVQRDDPRPFWIRLLLSLRYDFYHKDVRGGADF
jgi:hypothetical protein